MSAGKLNFKLVNDRALQSIDTVLLRWLPGGNRQGNEYVIANPTRSDSRAGSFSVNLTNGVWCDFATNDKGGDLIALVAYLDRIKNGEACKALAQSLGIDPSISQQGSAQQSAPPPKQIPSSPDFEPIRPVPESALSSCPASIRNLGKPSMYWDYLGEDGKEILLRVMRFDNTTGNGRPKDYRPFCYGKNKAGRIGWHSKAPTMNRPLYGLNKLATTPATANILLCEGEKATDAAQMLFPDAIAMTWPSGSKAISKADFTPLRSRVVWYWPDNDKAGSESIAPLRAVLGVAGVADFTPFNLGLLSQYRPGTEDNTGKVVLSTANNTNRWPDKADAADALAQGWQADHMRLLIEKGLTGNQRQKPSTSESQNKEEPTGRYQSRPEGLYCFSPKLEKYQCVGGPLNVAARSRDKHSEGWGLLVKFEDFDGLEKEWNIPGCFLVTEGGNKAVEGLIHRGYRLASHRDAKNQLREFLMGYDTTNRVRLVNRMGWHGQNAFMLPDRVIGEPAEPLHYYNDAPSLCKISIAGELSDWRDNIAKYCERNSLLTFAVCTAFAGPFLDIQGTESCGFHFFGDSSLGKSTLLKIAASVYGNPNTGEYTKTWRTTDNALEGMAAAHSDCLLVLDEIGQIEPRIVGETVYSLGSGVGKSRATEAGSNRGNQHRWRIVFISSGEKTLTDHMAEANRKPQAGMEMRLLTIPANPHTDSEARRNLGNFEHDHGLGGGAALSTLLTDNASRYHGSPIIRLIEAMVATDRDSLATHLNTARENFKFEILGGTASGQAHRAADKFALVAAAGEYASQIGITGWKRGWATYAASRAFRSWVAMRGGDGNLEDTKAINHIREMLTKYGESRFSRWESDDARIDEHAPRTMERWGFRKTITETYSNDGESSENIYYLTRDGLKDMCKGFDIIHVARLLKELNALETDKEEGRLTKKVRLPGSGKKAVNCYVIKLSALLVDDEPMSKNENIETGDHWDIP
ncbi:DUF927 domain-containing protein [uncultured Zhongshania sp.]|uniref:DUF927 domain-containing protein n=1 Tax=uncultured Zhongshania sp. TaxID=1642288 RepID=UPI0025CD590B|nr:DUF927 domain-containing protein [uncultured Zhongshania sp.]